MYAPTCKLMNYNGNLVWYRRDTKTGGWVRIS